MKNIKILLLILVVSYSCIKPNKNNQILQHQNDFEIVLFDKYTFQNQHFKKFIEDFINLPNNKNKNVFLLYIDQCNDSLFFTISSPYKKLNLQNSFGYFTFQGKIIIIYSPFYKLINSNKDTTHILEILTLFKNDFNSNEQKVQDTLMWQLQYLYFNDEYFINKCFSKIKNLTKPPIPKKTNIIFAKEIK